MNKGVIVAFIFVYFLILTFLVNGIYTTEFAVDDGFVGNLRFDGSSSVFDLMSVFWNMLTFQLHGVPSWMNLFFIYPPLIVIIYLIVEILKDVIPFT